MASTTACPICKSSVFRDYQQIEGRSLLICSDCRHLWWDDMPTPQQLAEHYGAEYTEKHHQIDCQNSLSQYYRQHAEELVSLSGVKPGQMKIADVGCSLPVFLREAKSFCSQAIGVDYAEEAHEEGRVWGLQMMTPEDFIENIPDGSLDVIRYSHVLEHLIDPLDVLAGNVKKLKPGGFCYITQPNFPVLRYRKSSVSLHDTGYPTHLHFFNPISMLAMVRKCGLTATRYFTEGEAREKFEIFENEIDFLYAADKLTDIKDIGEDIRGAFTIWPFFSGMNLGLHAYKAR